MNLHRKLLPLMPILVAGFLVASGVPTQAAATYTIKVSLEVKSKYPGTSSAENVIAGCTSGFPVDKNFTSDSRWEVLGSKNNVIATANVGKTTVKAVQQVLPPFHTADEPDLQPYIYGGTCVYSSSIKVPKSVSYKFHFAGFDLGTAYSFSELYAKKWVLVIKKDLNCGGTYGKVCK